MLLKKIKVLYEMCSRTNFACLGSEQTKSIKKKNDKMFYSETIAH